MVRSGTLFSIQFSRDEDDNWLAVVPELPGCVAGSPGLETTIIEIAEALQAVLEIVSEDDPKHYAMLMGEEESAGE